MPRNRQALCVLVTIVILAATAAGCGANGTDGPEEGVVHPPLGASGGSGTPPPPAESRPASTGGAQFPTLFHSWTGGGDLPEECELFWDFTIPRSRSVGIGETSPASIQLGNDRQICLTGFDPTEPVVLTVRRPDGSRHTTTVTGGAAADIGPTALLGGPLPSSVVFEDIDGYLRSRYEEIRPTLAAGRYSLTARQGGIRADGDLLLHRGSLGDPEASSVNPQDPWDVAQETHVGARLTFLLLDFPSNASVPLGLYRNTGHFRTDANGGDGYDFEFLRILDTVTVNADGWAYHTLVVPSLPRRVNEFNPDFCIVADTRLGRPYCKPGTAATFTLADR